MIASHSNLASVSNPCIILMPDSDNSHQSHPVSLALLNLKYNSKHVPHNTQALNCERRYSAYLRRTGFALA